MSFLSPQLKYFIEVASGNIPLESLANVQATNASVGTSFEDVWDQGGIMTLPAAAESWELVSTSSNDSATGAGVRSVMVFSLDENYNIQTPKIVEMNGLTPAPVAGTNFRTNGNMIAWTADPAGTRVNHGDITLQVAGGGAVRQKMLIGNGASFSSHYSVPAGCDAFSVGFNAFAPKGDNITIKAVLEPFGTDRAIISGGSFLAYQNFIALDQEPAFAVPEKTDFKMQAKSAASTVSVTTLQTILLRKRKF